MKAIVVSLLFLMSSGGSCESTPPFEYSNNTRIVVEAKLVNEDMTPLSSQTVYLKSFSSSTRIVVSGAISDDNGRIFISAPKGNNPMYLEFVNKDIVYTTNYSNLIHAPSSGDHWLGFLPNSYYDFSIITLKNKI